MKISILQENLTRALNHASKAVSTRPNIPILANILIEAKAGKVRLAATNLDISVNAWIGADIIEEGEVTVSAKLLTEFVSTVNPGKIELSQIGNTLEVKSVDNRAEFNIIPSGDFPTIPQVENEPLMKCNAKDFAGAVSQTAFAAALDDSRPVLTGLLLEATERKLSLVGVDGFRLSKKTITLETGTKEDFKEVIPAKALSELEKIVIDIAEEEDALEIFAMKNKNQMIFKVANIEFSTRVIEGEFPDYTQIMPKAKNTGFSVLKSEFSTAVKVAGIFARNVIGNKARFSVDPEGKILELRANVIDLGNNESKVSISKGFGDKVETAYNIKFLQDMLNVIKGEEINYETEGVTSPGVFRDKDDANFVHIIMPMRLE
ncbi:DNA polymerase III subunit beta [Candidatus Dojkabacteria bacterium]|nr:DNA polymerase III subunit beta [Candidatus Dojkabacteria bacterium]